MVDSGSASRARHYAAAATWIHTARRTYQPELSNVSLARAWAVAELAEHVQANDRLIPDVELVLSELLTNAIKAGAHAISVELRAQPTQVLISVEDDAVGQVTVQPPSPSAPGGRGLPIVAALSTEWGVDKRPRTKTVWARIDD